jgi:hypothetical protein
VRVLVGEKDNTVSVGECESVVAVLPRATLTVLKDTPHPIEQVDLARLPL